MIGNWKLLEVPRRFNELWAEANPGVKAPRAYHNPASNLTAFIGREPYGSDGSDVRWHISVRYGDRGMDGRVPSWEELVNTAHELRPGVCFVVGIPPRSWWMNVHPDVLHLIETRDEPLIQSFRDNALASVPS